MSRDFFMTWHSIGLETKEQNALEYCSPDGGDGWGDGCGLGFCGDSPLLEADESNLCDCYGNIYGDGFGTGEIHGYGLSNGNGGEEF